jgi:hemolysin activation/secretion protein/AraC-like DNA-binding protein
MSEPSQTSNPAHLSRFERIIVTGAEWNLVAVDWVVLQLCEGIAYAFDRNATQELPLGGVIVCPPKSELTITASVLGQAKFRGMAIRVSSLTGFLTALERQCLETEVARRFAPFTSLPVDHPLAKRTTQIFNQDQKPELSSRLAFAQTFAELVGPHLREAVEKGSKTETNQQEAKVRLRHLISQLPESELSSLSLGEMAKLLHCCERHASRLFRQEWGTGFPSYVSELRLKKACDLLRHGNLKIIDVALESGHGSLAHFNYVFKKRFRMTPKEWRDRHTGPPRRPTRTKPVQMMAMVALLLGIAGTGKLHGAPGTAGATTNLPAPATRAIAAATATNAAAKPSLKFKVDRYEVMGNTVLSSNLIARALEPYTGDAVDIGTITNAMATLQLEYYHRGYVTVKVTAPPQQVTNKVVVFQATEGRVTNVKIVHNNYYSSNNIMAALPYVETLESGWCVLNSKVFQTELDRANSNPDRQISPEVRPGLEPGTSALILDVKDRLPLHGRVDMDNYSPPGTPELRVNANASYGNLWQLDHTAGLQYGFSPSYTKPTLGDGAHVSLSPLDGPEVAYYSGFYRAPLGAPEQVQEQIAQDPNHFGYNEITRQFVPPPASGRPEFTAYASRSTTGPTMNGPTSLEAGGPGSLLTIEKQIISQQYTSQTTAGGRLSIPLPKWQEIQSSWSVGMDYKEDKVVTLPTNYFYYFTSIRQGSSANSKISTSESTLAIPGVSTFPALNYTPLFLGWNGSHPDHWGQSGPTGDLASRIDAGVSVVAGTGGTASRDRMFPTLIGNSKEATTEFVAIKPQMSRTQILPDNFTAYGNLSGQWANEPLLNLEEFALGGNATVRGYREGEMYSDTGVLGQVELRSPVYWRGANRRIGTQFSAFTDYAQGYKLDTVPGETAHQDLWGAGVGVNFNLGRFVESHILVAWPLLSSAFSRSGNLRVSFSLGAQL